MKQKILVCSLIIVLQVLTVSLAGAAGPWQFVESLPNRTADVALGETLALTVDTERQRYYVVDSSHSQLVSFDQQGKFLAALNPGNSLRKPVSMALASGGKLWVAERSTNQLLYVDLEQQQVRSFDLAYPDGLAIMADQVAVDRRNRLFVLDRSRGAVLRLDDNLKVEQTYIGTRDFNGFSKFLLNSDGLWALDGLGRSLTLFADDGKLVRKVKLAGKLTFPVAFAIDAAGQFFLLDRHTGKVVVFDNRGGYSYDFLLKGKRQGQLWFPSDLLFDWMGRLCLINDGNGRIDIYSR